MLSTKHKAQPQFPNDYQDKMLKQHKKFAQEDRGYALALNDSRSVAYAYTKENYVPELKKREEELKIAFSQEINNWSGYINLCTAYNNYKEIQSPDDHIFGIRKFESSSAKKSLSSLFCDDSVYYNYRKAKERLGDDEGHVHALYKRTIKDIITHPESLEKLILVRGLEHIIVAHTGGISIEGVEQKYEFVRNSVSSILNDQHSPNVETLIAIPLIHLAVGLGILPKVVSYLNQESACMKSLQGFHYVEEADRLISGPDDDAYNTDITTQFYDLDTPLKIAIDTLDIESFNILLNQGADPTTQVRAQLGISMACSEKTDKFMHGGEPLPLQSLWQYLIELDLNNKTLEDVECYTRICNLLYGKLPIEEQEKFYEAAKLKKIIILDLEGSSVEETLETELNLSNIKSARFTSASKSQEEELENKVGEEPAELELDILDLPTDLSDPDSSEDSDIIGDMSDL